MAITEAGETETGGSSVCHDKGVGQDEDFGDKRE